MAKNYTLMTECIKDAKAILSMEKLHVSDDTKTDLAMTLFKARRWSGLSG